MSICEVIGLNKDYPAFSLRGVTFSVEAGRICGFIGRNGAGKTTTIKSMLNLVHPTCGEVRYFGLPLIGNENGIKQRIGYSAGAVNYYPKKKLGELARITSGFYENWDDKAYRRYLDLFALDENKSPSELSEGMKVKCNLLLALSHKAEMLILDEPTSGLDPFSRDELTDLFGVLRDRGCAIFFSTHITSDLEKCADDVVYIRKGAIVSAGTKAGFSEKLGREGETLEQTMLRLEKEARDDEASL